MATRIGLVRRTSAVALGLTLGAAGVLVATGPAEAQDTVVLGTGNTIIGVAYEDANFSGHGIFVTSVNPGCTAPVTDMDFTIAVMPGGWNDEISSAQGSVGSGGFSACWWKFWRDGLNRGDSIGYSFQFQYVGDGFNDAASAGALS
jgi:hypothetical protein